MGGVGQTRPRLQTISSVRVPPLYLAFDRGLGVAPVRARTRKNTPPPPPSSSSTFVREIRFELFYIPPVKIPPSPPFLSLRSFSPQNRSRLLYSAPRYRFFSQNRSSSLAARHAVRRFQICKSSVVNTNLISLPKYPQFFFGDKTIRSSGIIAR